MNSPALRDGAIADLTLLSVRQVAELLGVHPRSVWRLAQMREIPTPIRLGGRVVRWRLSDLRNRLDTQSDCAKGASR